MKASDTKTASAPVQAKKSGASPFFSPEKGDSVLESSPAFFGENTGSEALFSPPPPIQAKLTIGAPDDPYEREADATAEKVVQRLAQPDAPTLSEPVQSIQRIPAPVQRACAECEQEEQKEGEEQIQEKVQRKAMFETPVDGEGDVQRKGDGAAQTSAPANFSAQLQSSKGGGSALPPEVSAQMGQAMGADFSGVRVHTGSEAAEMSQGIQAQAFTHGSDIYFNEGKYDTGSTDGQKLLAHELTHTVQQGGAGVAPKVQPRVQRLFGWVEDAAGWVYDTGSDAIGGVVDGAEWLGGQISDGAEWVAGVASDALGWVGEQLADAVRWIFEQIASVVTGALEWLEGKWNEVETFASTVFDNIRNGFEGLMNFITTPLSIIINALSELSADLLDTTWGTIKTGANSLYRGVKALTDTALSIGKGLWDGIETLINGTFGTLDRLVDSWAFDLLPDGLKSEARSMYESLKSRWRAVSRYWRDLWERLTQFIEGILSSVSSFLLQVVTFAINTVIQTVRDLKEVFDYVSEMIADPRAFIQPVIDQLANHLSDAPANAAEFGRNELSDQQNGSSSEVTGTIQRAASTAVTERRTATFEEVGEGLDRHITQQWNNLDLGHMIWEGLKNSFWPPATISAIGNEFHQLWVTDWANTVDSLYTPRNFFDDFVGCMHDLWSNFLILLEFPLALWRRLNNVVMLLMGYITIILVIIGAIAGSLAGGVGAIPGALAGLQVAGELGIMMMESYLLAEGLTVSVAMLQLLTARQVLLQRERDMLQIAASLIGMGVALALELLMTILSSIVAAIVSKIRGVGSSSVPHGNTTVVDTPPAGGGLDAPTSGGGLDAPTSGGGLDTPTSGGGLDAPTSGSGLDAPTSSGGLDAPTSGGGLDSPTSGGGLDAPTSGGGLDSPTSGGGLDAPTSGGGLDTPTSGGGLDSPTSGGGLDAPTSGGGLDTPTSGGGLDAPTSGGGLDTPTSGGVVDAPNSGSAVDTPTSGGGLDAPTSGGGLDSPTSGGGLDAPTSGGGLDAPTSGGVVDAPASGGAVDTPTSGGGVDTPTSGSTPETTTPGSGHPVQSYGKMRRNLPKGVQANHLNQNAAFRDVIPQNEGAANAMRGNAFTEVGSPHYNFHRSLESFWNEFRPGGARAGEVPTCGEYSQAITRALEEAGVPPTEIEAAVQAARQNREAFGLTDADPVPRIPGRINQRKPP